MKLEKEIRLADLTAIVGLVLAGLLWLASLQASTAYNSEEIAQNKQQEEAHYVDLRTMLARIEGKMDSHLLQHSED